LMQPIPYVPPFFEWKHCERAEEETKYNMKIHNNVWVSFSFVFFS
jgi:hypothetical protein